MADVKAIELKGIVHNTTKIGVRDGQAEDIVNLRFKDGAWRSTGDGKLLENVNVTDYTDLYIHTNVYRHLLGVKNGKLYWIASAPESDPNNFIQETHDPLCDIDGEVTITQTGHLISVILKSGIIHLLFSESDCLYNRRTIEANGDRDIIDNTPFTVGFKVDWSDSDIFNGRKQIYVKETENYQYTESSTGEHSSTNKTIARDGFIQARERVREDNKFLFPFLACAAFELYDGSYSCLTQPVLLYPNSKGNRLDTCEDVTAQGVIERKSEGRNNPLIHRMLYYRNDMSEIGADISNELYPLMYNLAPSQSESYSSVYDGDNVYKELKEDCPSLMSWSLGDGQRIPVVAKPNDLFFYIYGDLSIYKDIATSICIFITPEVDIYELNSDDDITFTDYIDTFRRIRKVFPKALPFSKIKDKLGDGQFFLAKRIPIESVSTSAKWRKIELDEGVLKNIVQQDRLDISSVSRNSYSPKYAYEYNGRLHLANYKETLFHGFTYSCFRQYSVTGQLDTNSKELYIDSEGSEAISKKKPMIYIEVEIDTEYGTSKVSRYQMPVSDYIVYSLNPIISYPDIRAKKMRIYCSDFAYESGVRKYFAYKKEYTLKPSLYSGYAYYINDNLEPITIFDVAVSSGAVSVLDGIPEENGETINRPNVVKVSGTQNPMYFPVKNTYQIGSSEIIAMCSNAVAVGTGQTGSAPLYIFCRDGVYALFVDASGEMTYTNARVIARDVCNNAKSVTPIDDGVVFSTDRGLMMISGSEVVEIGQPLEGDYRKFAVIRSVDYDRVCRNAYKLPLLADLSLTSLTQTDFLNYLKDTIVAYNHNERELMIGNTKRVNGRLYYDYMYVLDRHGNWTRRDYNAEQFVENYPVTFRVRDGKMYQMDEDSDADNGIFAMSNVVKLDSIGFKSINRIVARGVFNTECGRPNTEYILGGSGVTVVDKNEIYRIPFTTVKSGNARVNICGLQLTFPDGAPDFYEDEESDYWSIKVVSGNSVIQEYKIPIVFGTSGPELSLADKTFNLPIGSYELVISLCGVMDAGYDYEWSIDQDDTFEYLGAKYVGIYAFGSYDGHKWACLGHKEKKGNFTDLGCNVERTDCKFFRFLLAGRITKDSRLDYFEVSAKQSRLSTKIR